MYSYHLVMDWVLTGQSLSLEMFRNWFLKVHPKKCQVGHFNFAKKSDFWLEFWTGFRPGFRTGFGQWLGKDTSLLSSNDV